MPWIIAGCLVGSAVAQADDEPTESKLTIGTRLAPMRVVSKSVTAPLNTEGQDTAYGVGVYGEWRLSRYFAVGLEVPGTLNGPGPTTNEYDVGIAVRLRFDYPVTESIRPYLSVSPGFAWSRLPESIWWNGTAINAGLGVRFDLSKQISVTAELAFEATDFSGNVILPGDTLATNGTIKAAYLGGGLGVELHL